MDLINERLKFMLSVKMVPETWYVIKTPAQKQEFAEIIDEMDFSLFSTTINGYSMYPEFEFNEAGDKIRKVMFFEKIKKEVK